MASLSDYLTDDHNHCDTLFANAENAVSERHWQEAERQFGAFRAAVERHFAREESILFPEFEQRTGMTQGPTLVMREEHDQMRAALAGLADRLARRAGAAYLDQSDTLLMLMRQHNMKEEQVLYPMSERVLDDVGADLIEAMRLIDPSAAT